MINTDYAIDKGKVIDTDGREIQINCALLGWLEILTTTNNLISYYFISGKI